MSKFCLKSTVLSRNSNLAAKSLQILATFVPNGLRRPSQDGERCEFGQLAVLIGYLDKKLDRFK